jgi:hypothetical protein
MVFASRVNSELYFLLVVFATQVNYLISWGVTISLNPYQGIVASKYKMPAFRECIWFNCVKRDFFYCMICVYGGDTLNYK